MDQKVKPEDLIDITKDRSHAPFAELTLQENENIDTYLEKKGLLKNMNLTFADVVQPEQYSNIWSRSHIQDFDSKLVSSVVLKTPFTSANMESVTGVELAVAMEREGGFGFIPQTLDIEEKEEMIERIKRSNSANIEKPLTISPLSILRDAKEVMNRFNIYTLIVIDESGCPMGVLSGRDWRYETNDAKFVYDLLPERKLIFARSNISLNDAAIILKNNRVEKLPLVDAKGKLSGLITAHGLFYTMRHPRATRDGKGRFLVAGSIGVAKKDDLSDLPKLYDEVRRQLAVGATFILIDTARAFSINMWVTVEMVKRNFPGVSIIAGNVSTPKGAKFLFELGVDCVKVGQGSGSRCLTRHVGTGIPQISAIAKCSVIAREYEKTLIADGGMKTPGDFANAIVAGANTTMSGSAFIITEESSAKAQPDKSGRKVKIYSGAASYTEQDKRLARGDLDAMRRPEGFTEQVYVVGNTRERFQDLLGGLRSSLSYYGVSNLDELREKAVFELQSQAGRSEGLKE
ncbi:MAG: IMP dehydrogenase [bacterium]|nr:IMP dehydrogenase [bacterium]